MKTFTLDEHGLREGLQVEQSSSGESYVALGERGRCTVLKKIHLDPARTPNVYRDRVMDACYLETTRVLTRPSHDVQCILMRINTRILESGERYQVGLWQLYKGAARGLITAYGRGHGVGADKERYTTSDGLVRISSGAVLFVRFANPDKPELAVEYIFSRETGHHVYVEPWSSHKLREMPQATNETLIQEVEK